MARKLDWNDRERTCVVCRSCPVAHTMRAGTSRESSAWFGASVNSSLSSPLPFFSIKSHLLLQIDANTRNLSIVLMINFAFSAVREQFFRKYITTVRHFHNVNSKTFRLTYHRKLSPIIAFNPCVCRVIAFCKDSYVIYACGFDWVGKWLGFTKSMRIGINTMMFQAFGSGPLRGKTLLFYLILHDSQ